MNLTTKLAICVVIMSTAEFVVIASGATNTASPVIEIAKIETVLAIGYMIFMMMSLIMPMGRGI